MAFQQGLRQRSALQAPAPDDSTLLLGLLGVSPSSGLLDDAALLEHLEGISDCISAVGGDVVKLLLVRPQLAV